MDEMTMLAAARPPAPDFAASDRAAARQQLLIAIAAERAVPARAGLAGRSHAVLNRLRPGQPVRNAPFRRIWTPWSIGVTGAVAALCAAAAVLFVALPGTQGGAGQENAQVSAKGLLLLAARSAAAAPSLSPRPRQFVYTEQIIVGEASSNGSKLVKTPPYLQRTWISANGMWGGLAKARNAAGGRWYTNELPIPVCAIPDPSNANWKANCPAPPGYVTTLPSTVPGMLAYLRKYTAGLGGSLAYQVLTGIAQESWEARLLIPNHSYALMFRAAATVQGIQVIQHVTDAAGRSGIAVAACVPGAIQKVRPDRGCGHRIELIFDPRTYQFIGDNEVGSLQAGGASSALFKIAVVGKAGQLP
ncbi:MAG: CU044_5270 family protein [Streptosporangiaceae bacterium]